MICTFNFPHHFTFTYYLLLNSCNEKNAKQRVFLGNSENNWLCRVLALKTAGLIFITCSRWCPFAFTHAHNRFHHGPTASTFCDMLAHVSLMRCIKSLVSWTCVLYNVHTVSDPKTWNSLPAELRHQHRPRLPLHDARKLISSSALNDFTQGCAVYKFHYYYYYYYYYFFFCWIDSSGWKLTIR